MNGKITDNLRVANALNFVSSTEDQESTSYAFLGRYKKWDGDTEVVPSADSTSEVQILDDIICARKIMGTNSSLLIARNDWISGISYDQAVYGSQPDNTNYYVTISKGSGKFHIYICLDNASGAPSTNQPTHTIIDELGPATTIETYADGYTWQFIMETSDSINFLSNAYVSLNGGTGSTAILNDAAKATVTSAGFGKTPEYDLKAKYVGISIDFDGSFSFNSKFRQVGIVKDPNETLGGQDEYLTRYHNFSVTEVGDPIIQLGDEVKHGEIVIGEVVGYYYHESDSNYKLSVLSSNDSHDVVVNQTLSIGGITDNNVTVVDQVKPNYEKGTGGVLFFVNMVPQQRNPLQSETLRFVLTF